MDLKSTGRLQYNNVIKYRKNSFIEKNNETEKTGFNNSDHKSTENKQRLREVINEFTSLLVQKMFKSMRDTIPEDKLIDGGFSEEVFTDMLDSEVSKLGARQENFASLNRLLFQQLTGKNERM